MIKKTQSIILIFSLVAALITVGSFFGALDIVPMTDLGKFGVTTCEGLDGTRIDSDSVRVGCYEDERFREFDMIYRNCRCADSFTIGVGGYPAGTFPDSPHDDVIYETYTPDCNQYETNNYPTCTWDRDKTECICEPANPSDPNVNFIDPESDAVISTVDSSGLFSPVIWLILIGLIVTGIVIFIYMRKK